VSLELTRKANSNAQEARRTAGREERHRAHNTATLAISTAMCELERGGRHYGRWLLRVRRRRRQEAVERPVAVQAARCAGVDGRRRGPAAVPSGHRDIALPGRGCACAPRPKPTWAPSSRSASQPTPAARCKFIRGIRTAHFAARAAELAQRYGERFVIKESALEKLRQSKSLEV